MASRMALGRPSSFDGCTQNCTWASCAAASGTRPSRRSAPPSPAAAIAASIRGRSTPSPSSRISGGRSTSRRASTRLRCPFAGWKFAMITPTGSAPRTSVAVSGIVDPVGDHRQLRRADPLVGDRVGRQLVAVRDHRVGTQGGQGGERPPAQPGVGGTRQRAPRPTPEPAHRAARPREASCRRRAGAGRGRCRGRTRRAAPHPPHLLRLGADPGRAATHGHELPLPGGQLEEPRGGNPCRASPSSRRRRPGDTEPLELPLERAPADHGEHDARRGHAATARARGARSGARDPPMSSDPVANMIRISGRPLGAPGRPSSSSYRSMCRSAHRSHENCSMRRAPPSEPHPQRRGRRPPAGWPRPGPSTSPAAPAAVDVVVDDRGPRHRGGDDRHAVAIDSSTALGRPS